MARRCDSSISVLCMTADSGPRVAALLAPLRAVADEILIVADDRVGSADLGWYASVADRLIRFPYAEPVERPLAWAHAQCTGGWVLRVDGDEWVSPELVAALPALVQRQDRVQYWIPRRWCYPTPDLWLAERPWSPDLQLRLVRNDPALLSFPGLMHTSARPMEPAEILEAPIYHLDLVLKPEPARREKVARYEALRSGLTVSGGGPMESYYLPERWSELEPSLAPEHHAATLHAVVDRQPKTAPAPVEPEAVSLATREDVDAYWEGRALTDSGRRIRLRACDDDPRLVAGAADVITVQAENSGDAAWPGGLERGPLVRLGHRWRTPEGDLVTEETPRTGLPCPLAPGDSTLVQVAVSAPAEPGRYVLEVEAVEELVAWFGDPLAIPVSVRLPRER